MNALSLLCQEDTLCLQTNNVWKRNKIGSTCLNKVYYSFLEKHNNEVFILVKNIVFEVLTLIYKWNSDLKGGLYGI